MSLLLSGTNGLSDVDGSASTPAVRGTDTNTGIFFPAADAIAFAEGGVESMRLDSNGDVNLYSGKSFKSYNPANTRFGSFLTSVDGTVVSSFNGSGEPLLLTAPTGYFTVSTNGSERMRIDSSGILLIGTTTSQSGFRAVMQHGNSGTGAGLATVASTTDAVNAISFQNSNGQIGRVQVSGTTTTYVTSSDYRLKENIAPMTGALAKVSELKPVTYTWKTDGSSGQGFIAHELQEVVPEAIAGNKDEVDAEGNPVYQGIDTSFLVATLTAAIQEQQAIITDLKQRIETLEQA